MEGIESKAILIQNKLNQSRITCTVYWRPDLNAHLVCSLIVSTSRGCLKKRSAKGDRQARCFDTRRLSETPYQTMPTESFHVCL